MDVDVLSILSSASYMLQRVLPRVFSSAAPQGSSVSAQLGNVRQAGAAAPGRPIIPPSPPSYSRGKDVMLRIARRELGARREFALDTIANAGMARRNGDNALARKTLAIGLATLVPTRMAATGDDSTFKPEAMHAGWQANFDRGVTSLIARVDDLLHKLQQDANADVVHGDASRDALLEAIRADGGITATYRHAVTRAAMLNNGGRHYEALAALRQAPAHQGIMNYFAAPTGAPGSDGSRRALSTADEALYRFQTLVNGDDVPADNLGQEVSYARGNPDVLRIRGLVQSVGAELLRVGDYHGVMDTVRPPVPPRPAA